MTVMADEILVRRRVRVSGLVQGVGFRPFVHQLATAMGLSGFVGNDSAGVFAEVEGPVETVDRFLVQLAVGPPMAVIDSIDSTQVARRAGSGFTIIESRCGGRPATVVAPDTAVCDDCLTELFDPADRRYRYPFITCTNCGPRFTITTALPYDRPTTTMAGFELCTDCMAQYTDPADRRFHAQPLACAECGPRLWIEGPDGRSGSDVSTADGRVAYGRVEESDAAIVAAQRKLAAGAIVAIKGVGGYHLACDARSDRAVERLRFRKHRPDRPLAVMARDLGVVEQLALVDDSEAELLVSPARPIVLLRARPGNGLARGVAPGSPRLGVMLPYAPLHHLLFAPVPGRDGPVPDVVVMTSGNLSDEPICYDDADATERLGEIADAFMVHDRPIHVPCDDSVVRVVDGECMPIRRSRGYAPMPIRLPVPVAATPVAGTPVVGAGDAGSLVEDGPAGILAVGAELKNTFCVARGHDAWLSQHIGDMGSMATLLAFERSVAQFLDLYGIEPAAIATDLHPSYSTTAWAERSAVGELQGVQHHHAHLAALLAEHGVALDAEVIGVVFDGTGYGADGTIWGGEVLVGGYTDVRRSAHLKTVPLAGGDATIRRPYRSALSHLYCAGVEWEPTLPCVRAAKAGECDLLAQQFVQRVQCIPSSSMGRLFDAVASLLDVRHVVSYEAQAAVELEELAASAGPVDDRYRFAFDGTVFDAAPVLAAIVADRRDGVRAPVIAAAFHAAVAAAVVEVAVAERNRSGCDVVGLTGGTFQNAVLLSATRRRLERNGFSVLIHRRVPSNDGGLALGQAAIVAARAARAATFGAASTRNGGHG